MIERKSSSLWSGCIEGWNDSWQNCTAHYR